LELGVQLGIILKAQGCNRLALVPMLFDSGCSQQQDLVTRDGRVGADSVLYKVEEKRENFSLRNLRKPEEREREKYPADFVEISHTKKEKTFL